MIIAALKFEESVYFESNTNFAKQLGVKGSSSYHLEKGKAIKGLSAKSFYSV